MKKKYQNIPNYVFLLTMIVVLKILIMKVNYIPKCVCQPQKSETIEIYKRIILI